jgi:5-methylcytosine-specific restriction protein A
MPNKPPRYRPPNARPPQPPTPRPSAAERGYGWRWQRVRAAYLAANPLCVHCQADGRITEATVVDHIIPHKGDEALFYEEGNFQSLCKRCHDVKTATTDGGWGRPVKPTPPVGETGPDA